MTDSLHIRSACAADEAIIKAMIRSERLDPFNVHWQNFLVAIEGERIVGIGQVKPYHSGRELGSLVVVADRRQTGVAGAIINALIARENGPLLLFCLSFREPFYAKFGFRRVGLADIPGEFKLKYALGTVFTRLVGKRLIVMKHQSGLSASAPSGPPPHCGGHGQFAPTTTLSRPASASRRRPTSCPCCCDFNRRSFTVAKN